MYWQLISKGLPPVTLSQAKEFSRIDTANDDVVVQMLIDSCTELGEKLLSKVMRLTMYSGEVESCAGGFSIHKAVVQSVDEISYLDNGVVVIIDPVNYTLKKSKQLASVASAGDYAFPVGITLTVAITCDVDDELLPQVQQAVLHHVNFLYENRGDVSAVDSLSMPLESKLFYNDNKVVRV